MGGGENVTYKFDKLEFNAQLARKGKRRVELAKALGIDPSTLYRKIENGGDFDRDQIAIILNFLEIENPMPIFFVKELT